MNNFVWADLSTYDPGKSKPFYENVFDWQFHNADGYFVAMQGSVETTGMFETPEFFKKIKMPHFWMSYIAVDNVVRVSEIAKEFDDAKVELTDEFYGGNIALIRDPQGAGFTIYDGGKLDSRKNKAGHMMWNELHVSGTRSVIPFYERLFSWTIRQGKSAGKYHVFNANQEHISDISMIPNELKGKYEYWVCTFAVDNLKRVRTRIEENGGAVVFDEGKRVMMHDNSGEAFFYIQSVT